MEEDFDRADQPMLPVVLRDDGDPLHLLLASLHEGGVLFQGGEVVPTFQLGGIDQSDLAFLFEDGCDFLGQRREVARGQLYGRDDFQNPGGR
jgi:hypothetical protein